jgi:hypothetical protein
LNFDSNRFTGIPSFKTAFKSLINLEQFHIDLSNNYYIYDISPIENAFSNLRKLKSFYIDLSNNGIASGVDELSHALLYDIGPRQAFCPFNFNIKSNPLATD